MAKCRIRPTGHSGRDHFRCPTSLTNMAAIVLNSGLGKMPTSASEVDPNFVLPGPGMDSPARPPTGKWVSPPRFIPGHPPRVVSNNSPMTSSLFRLYICTSCTADTSDYSRRQCISSGCGTNLVRILTSIGMSSSHLAFRRQMKTFLFKASFCD